MYRVLGLIYVILSLGLFVIMFLPFDNIVYEGNKIQTLKNEYKVGELVTYTAKYDKKFNISAIMIKSVEIHLDDENIHHHKISLAPRIGNIPAGHHHLVAEFQLPNVSCIVGEAKIVIDADYSIFGGLRVIHDRVESNVFTITK